MPKMLDLHRMIVARQSNFSATYLNTQVKLSTDGFDFLKRESHKMPAKHNHRRWGAIRKLPSGRFQASFVGPDLRRYNGPRPFPSKMLAEGWLAREYERIVLCDSNGTAWESPTQRKARTAVRGETLADYGARWIAQRNIKDSTRALYTDQFEKHIKPTIGQIAIATLTLDDVNRWHCKLLPGKPRVRSQTYGLLRAMCSSAVEADLLPKNPCAIKGAGSTNRTREPVLLTPDELTAVAVAIKPERFKAFVLISAWGAMRFGEVIELRRKDISAGCVTATVARGAYHLKGCHVGPTKSGKSRVVVLPPHIRVDVKHHLDTFVGADPNALLFPTTRQGCHLAQNVFREAFNKACKSVGREGVNVHALRHFGATMAARVGATPAEVQARLGHSTFKAAMAYQHAADDRQHDIAAALSTMAESAR